MGRALQRPCAIRAPQSETIAQAKHPRALPVAHVRQQKSRRRKNERATRAAMRFTLNKADTLNIANRGLTAPAPPNTDDLAVALNDSKKQTPWCPISPQSAGPPHRQSATRADSTWLEYHSRRRRGNKPAQKKERRAPFATIVAAAAFRVQRLISEVTPAWISDVGLQGPPFVLSARGSQPDRPSAGMPARNGWGGEDLAARPYVACAAGSTPARPVARSRPTARAMEAAFASEPNRATVGAAALVWRKKAVRSSSRLFCSVGFAACTGLSSPSHRNGPCRRTQNRSATR